MPRFPARTKTIIGAFALILPLGLAGCAYEEPYGYGGGSYYPPGSSYYYPSESYYYPQTYSQGYYSQNYYYPGNEYWYWSERDRRYYRRDRDGDHDRDRHWRGSDHDYDHDHDHDHDRDRDWANRHDRDGDGRPDWREGNRGNWNHDRDHDADRRDWVRQQHSSTPPQYVPPPNRSLSGAEATEIMRQGLREQGLKVPPRH